MGDDKELKEIKDLILDYIFPIPESDFLEEDVTELKAKGLYDLALKCLKSCQVLAKGLVDEELKKRRG